MTRARNTLRMAGCQVVPGDMTETAFRGQSISSDGTHIVNDENKKELFAKAWASWLLACSDTTFGTVEEECDERAKSRSPRREAIDQSQVSAGFVGADGAAGGKGKD